MMFNKQRTNRYQTLNYRQPHFNKIKNLSLIYLWLKFKKENVIDNFKIKMQLEKRSVKNPPHKYFK